MRTGGHPATSERVLDRCVADLIREADFVISSSATSDGVSIREPETEFDARFLEGANGGEGHFEIEVLQRGASNGLDLSTTRRELVQHYLIHTIGHQWRMDHGISMIPSAVRRAVAPEYEAVQESPGDRGVRGIVDGQWMGRQINKSCATSRHTAIREGPRYIGRHRGGGVDDHLDAEGGVLR